jgi:hypothetical protein
MSADSFDLASLAATDAWLDDVSARTASPGDPLAASLVGWLDQIDAAYQPRPLHVPVVRPRRVGRRSASLAAAGVLVLAGAGTAVAAPSSPVHRAIFGSPRSTTPVPRPDETAELSQAAGLVASTAAVVAEGQAHGFLADDVRASATGSLDHAVAVLEPMSDSPVKTSLEERIAMLRLEMGKLPNEPASTTTPASQLSRSTETPEPEATPPAADATPRAEPSESAPSSGGDSSATSSEGSDH